MEKDNQPIAETISISHIFAIPRPVMADLISSENSLRTKKVI